MLWKKSTFRKQNRSLGNTVYDRQNNSAGKSKLRVPQRRWNKNMEVIDNRGEYTKPGYPKRDPTRGKKKEKAWTGINYQSGNTRQSLRHWRMWMSILNWQPHVQNHDWRQTQRKSPLSSNLRTWRAKEKSYVHAKGRCVTSRKRETQSGFGVSTGTLNHIR